MEIVGHGGKRFLWEVLNNHYVVEQTDNYEIGLCVFILFFRQRREEGR